MYKEDLALNNLQGLNCYKPKANQTIHIQNIYEKDLALNNQQWLNCYILKSNQILHIKYICIKRIWH